MRYLSIGSISDKAGSDGLIFDIQKFSIHDGPGVRTLVFCVGCTLRCRWCANPESQDTKPKVMWNINTCRRCYKCTDICPAGAIAETDAGKIIDHKKCVLCGKCDEVCASQSIMVAGRHVTVDEVMKVVSQDEVFYETSGGGLTIGGGEPLLQPGFVKKLAQAAHDKGYSTAIETAGFVPWENFELSLGLIDLYLFDIKSLNPETHRKNTGADNGLILENLNRLIAAGGDVCVRTPVIPGVNEGEVNDIAEYAGRAGAASFEMLPYHMLGEGKYSQLGYEYPMSGTKRFDKDVVEEMKQRAQSAFDSTRQHHSENRFSSF